MKFQKFTDSKFRSRQGFVVYLLSSVLWAQLCVWVRDRDREIVIWVLIENMIVITLQRSSSLLCWWLWEVVLLILPKPHNLRSTSRLRHTISILPHMLKDQHLRHDHHQHHYQGSYTTWPLYTSWQKSSKSKDHRSLVFLYNLQQKPLLCDLLKFSWYFD